MAERVVLHIGAPKTGTTYLQTIMWRNRARLRAAGFLYPGERRMDHHDATLVSRGRAADRRAGAWERLTAEIRDFAGTGILTHEFYAAASAEGAAAALQHLAPAEVVLVYTARDYATQLPAYWQESVKMGDQRTLGAYTAAMLAGLVDTGWSWLTMDTEAVLRRWTATLAPEQVFVVTVPPPGAPRDLLWQRFASVVGLDTLDLDTDVARPNESLGVVQAELVRRVVPRLDPELRTMPQLHRWVREEFAHQVLVPQGGERFAVRPPEAERLRQASAESARYLESAGFQVVGDLSDLVPAQGREAPHPDDVSDAELLGCARQAVSRLLDRLEEIQAEVRRLSGADEGPVQPTGLPMPPHDSATLDTVLDAVARLVLLQRDAIQERDRCRRGAEHEAAAAAGNPPASAGWGPRAIARRVAGMLRRGAAAP